MLKKTTVLKICSMAMLISVVSAVTAGGMVKDGAGHPVMGVAQPMMADTMDKMDKMDKKPMMDDKMDKMEEKPMMDDKMKK